MCLKVASTMGTIQHSFNTHMEYSFQVCHNSTAKSRAATLIFSDHHDTAKMNMWHGLLYNHVEGPFIFAENTINGNINLRILNMSPFPQIEVTGKEEEEEGEEEVDKLLLLSSIM